MSDADFDSMIISVWGTMPSGEAVKRIQERFPEKTRQQIVGRIGKIRREGKVDVGRYRHNKTWRAWTDQEVAFLKENAGKMPAREIANALGRSQWSVINQASVRGIYLSVGHQDIAWTDEALGTLRESLRSLIDGGYSPASVIYGIRKLKKNGMWT